MKTFDVPTNFQAAMSLTRGSYQRDIVRGIAKLSGGDLKGKASKYGIHYHRSRQAVIARLRENGIVFTVRGDGTAKGGARYLDVAE